MPERPIHSISLSEPTFFASFVSTLIEYAKLAASMPRTTITIITMTNAIPRSLTWAAILISERVAPGLDSGFEAPAERSDSDSDWETRVALRLPPVIRWE